MSVINCSSFAALAFSLMIFAGCSSCKNQDPSPLTPETKILVDSMSGALVFQYPGGQVPVSEIINQSIGFDEESGIDILMQLQDQLSGMSPWEVEVVNPASESSGTSTDPRYLDVLFTNDTIPFTFGIIKGGGETSYYFYSDKVFKDGQKIADLGKFESFDELYWNLSDAEFADLKKGFTPPGQSDPITGFPTSKKDFNGKFRYFAPDGKGTTEANKKCGSGTNIPPFSSNSKLRWFITDKDYLRSYKKGITKAGSSCTVNKFHLSRKCLFDYTKDTTGAYNKFTCSKCN